MTTQERINSLAEAALQKESSAVPAPAKAPASISTSKVEASPVPNSPGAAAQAKPGAASDLDAELRAAIDIRDEKMRKQRSGKRLAINLCLLALLGSGVGWATLSESGSQKTKAFVTALRESKGDIKNLANLMGTYNKQLDKIAVQSARVDEATRALGIDPSKEPAGPDSSLNAEMKKLAGGDSGGPTSMERDEKLREKFGIVSKIAGSDPAKAKAEANSDVQF